MVFGIRGGFKKIELLFERVVKLLAMYGLCFTIRSGVEGCWVVHFYFLFQYFSLCLCFFLW
jgi:hypothetical protein